MRAYTVLPSMTVTTREQAINDIFEHASKRSQFRLGDVDGYDRSSTGTTYQRAATSLEDLGWLQRDSDGGKVWKRGPKLRDLMRGVPV